MKVLVICNSSRSIVCSARKAGYTVFALDEFGDIDLLGCAEKAQILKDVNEKRIYSLAESFGDIDAVVLGPGYEKLNFKRILNNRKEVMEEVNDKLKMAKKFRSMDILHPEVVQLEKASELGFPLMVKPRFGSGGVLNRLVKNESELADLEARSDANKFIAQEFVEGVPCSASMICNGDDSAVIALNEQFIGVPWLTRLPFAYCGNITPFYTKSDDEMIRYAKQAALEFKLLGSNGVDFVLNDEDVYVIEVNPRFQGSLDTVELSTGINIFDAHVKSFSGELPKLGEPLRFAAKAIVFADKKVTIDQSLSDKLVQYMDMGRAADIPRPGWVVKADEPITTLLETGNTHKKVLEKIRSSADYIKIITET